jgi:hypothetical protein
LGGLFVELGVGQKCASCDPLLGFWARVKKREQELVALRGAVKEDIVVQVEATFQEFRIERFGNFEFGLPGRASSDVKGLPQGICPDSKRSFSIGGYQGDRHASLVLGRT